MKRVLTKHEDLFGPWMMKILDGGHWFPGRGSIIGLWDDAGGPLSACLFENYNKASIMLHIATDGTKRWMNREYLWFVHHFPFIQLRVKKIVCPIESTNLVCIKFVEHLGYTREATLSDAAPNGDMLIYTMTKDQCKWLSLGSRYRGQSYSTNTK